MRAFKDLHLDPALPIMRAHGVPEVTAYLEGTMTLAAATEKAQKNTRNYAKRQMTWLRNQMQEALKIDADQPIKSQLNAISCLLF